MVIGLVIMKCGNDLINWYQISFNFFAEMSSDVVSVKLRVHNKIYTVKLSPSGVTDVLLKGNQQSTIV